MEDTKLETPDGAVRLRAVEPGDLDFLYFWENNPETWIFGDNITPFSRFELEKYILSEGDIYANKQLRLMIDCRRDDKYVTVGTVDLFDFDPRHERAGVGVIIYAPSDRRQGYASTAIKLLTAYAFNTLNIKVLYCNIGESNIASLECLKRCGFETVGLKKAWNRTRDGRENVYLLQSING
jgi:diamine N-acetyltransferase